MTNLKMFLIEHWYPEGKTDSDIARLMSVDKALICRWVNGKSEPSLERKLQIAKILGVDSRLIFPDKEK